MQILTGLGSWPMAIAFSPDGRYLAAGDSNAFHLWDLSAGPDPLWSVQDFYIGRNFCFAPDGASVVGGHYSMFARYDVRTGTKVDDSPFAAISPHQFSPDGRFALAADTNRTADVLRLRCARAGPYGWTDVWQKEFAYS